jgi:hypothetical protein
MRLRSYRLGLLIVGLLAALVMPGIASAQSCTVCLSSSGSSYYGSSANSFNSGYSSSYSTSPSYSSYGGYGSLSEETGRPRTNYVGGYYRDNGTYVSPYYRSSPSYNSWD